MLWEQAAGIRPHHSSDPDAMLLTRNWKHLLLWRPAADRLCARGCLDLDHPAGFDWLSPERLSLIDPGVEADFAVGAVIVDWVEIDSAEDPRSVEFRAFQRGKQTHTMPAWPIFEDQEEPLIEALLDVVKHKYFFSTPSPGCCGVERDTSQDHLVEEPLYKGGGWSVCFWESDCYQYLENEKTREPRRFADRESADAAFKKYLARRVAAEKANTY